jgi:signal transduction histidine kinase
MTDTLQPGGGRTNTQHSWLLSKFLVLVVCAYSAVALPALYLAAQVQFTAEQELLAAYVGVQATKSAAAIGKGERSSNRDLVRDLMAPLAQSPAFVCAKFETLAAADFATVAIPSRRGCDSDEGSHSITLPVGADGKSTLIVRYSDAGNREFHAHQLALSLFAFAASILVVVFAAYIAFRRSVIGRIRTLIRAIEARAAGGAWRIVEPGTLDELGVVIAHVNTMVTREELQSRRMQRLNADLHQERSTLAELNETLERRVVERTQELDFARKAAESANAAKSRFMWSMSHELKTPLNAIIGFSELISAETFGPVGSKKYVEYAGDINASGKRLLHAVSQILLVAKLDDRNIVAAAKGVDLQGLIENVCGDRRAMAAERNISLHVAEGLQDWQAFGDEALLEIAIGAIVENAIKFNRAGGLVQIALDRSPHEFAILVKDTGIGIPSDRLQSILEPFGQADERLARKFEGVGLGLTIAAKIVRNHGGRLDISSNDGSGTCVRVVLPVRRIVGGCGQSRLAS